MGGKKTEMDAFLSETIVGLDREIFNKKCFRQLSLKSSQQIFISLCRIQQFNLKIMTAKFHQILQIGSEDLDNQSNFVCRFQKAIKTLKTDIYATFICLVHVLMTIITPHKCRLLAGDALYKIFFTSSLTSISGGAIRL